MPPLLHRILKRFALSLGILGLLLSVLVGVMLIWGFQLKPLPIAPSTGSKAQLAQQLMHARLLHRTFQGEAMHLALPVSQINALLADLAQRAVGGQAALVVPVATAPNASTAPHKLLKFVVSLPVGSTPLRRLLPDAWINLETTWEVRTQGQFKLQRVLWGRLPIPVSWVTWGLDVGLSHYKLKTFSDIALRSIQSLDVSADEIRVGWQWREELKALTFSALIPVDELSRIHTYHSALVQHIELIKTQAGAPAEGIPLLTLIKPLFQLAQQRTLAQQLNAELAPSVDQLPIQENRAALLVLTLHAMRVTPADLIPQAKKWPSAHPYTLTLMKREDFAQHYLLSALIASGVGGRVADLIGLYKEQSDKVAGSGFSFNDIAADRAGIRLGQRARLAAQQLQARIQEGQDESFLMPNVEDIPQFLSAHEFQNQFSGENHGAYEEMLKLIDKRVDQLGVLQ